MTVSEIKAIFRKCRHTDKKKYTLIPVGRGQFDEGSDKGKHQQRTRMSLTRRTHSSVDSAALPLHHCLVRAMQSSFYGLVKIDGVRKSPASAAAVSLGIDVRMLVSCGQSVREEVYSRSASAKQVLTPL